MAVAIEEYLRTEEVYTKAVSDLHAAAEALRRDRGNRFVTFRNDEFELWEFEYSDEMPDRWNMWPIKIHEVDDE